MVTVRDRAGWSNGVSAGKADFSGIVADRPAAQAHFRSARLLRSGEADFVPVRLRARPSPNQEHGQWPPRSKASRISRSPRIRRCRSSSAPMAFCSPGSSRPSPSRPGSSSSSRFRTTTTTTAKRWSANSILSTTPPGDWTKTAGSMPPTTSPTARPISAPTGRSDGTLTFGFSEGCLYRQGLRHRAQGRRPARRRHRYRLRRRGQCHHRLAHPRLPGRRLGREPHLGAEQGADRQDRLHRRLPRPRRALVQRRRSRTSSTGRRRTTRSDRRPRRPVPTDPT